MKWPARVSAIALCASLCGSLWTTAGPAPRDNAPLPNDLVARGQQGAVVTAEPHATQIGLDVLQKGGNAVDAAVAVALALAVTHPQAGNLGGGGFMVIRLADGRTAAIDFRERAPKSATTGMYLKADGSVDTDKVQFGASAAGVPGSPAGLLYALQKFGTQSLPAVAAPAILLAREGFPVDHFLASALESEKKNLGRYASTRVVFFRGEKPLAQGRNSSCSPIWRRRSNGSASRGRGLLRRRTAELIEAQMKKDGGFVTREDLQAYSARREREVLRATYRDTEVLSMPPPSSGGVALLQMLNLLEPYDLATMGFGGSEYLHLLTEVMRRAYADRGALARRSRLQRRADRGPRQQEVCGEAAREHRSREEEPGRARLAARPKEERRHDALLGRRQGRQRGACTTTINSTFGAMLVVDGAGFLLNNEMDDFSAKPGVPNQFGLVGGKANAIEPASACCRR
jgi:gamma-glutamyltranspeptidase/glutathione hydrolase